jgi:hypothetical protein
MLGIILGVAAAIGVGRLLRRRAWYRRFGGYGGGCHGGHGFDGYGGPGMHRFDGQGPGYGYGPGVRGPSAWALRGLFARLETTPGQERVIVTALDELRENRRVIRDEMRATRGDLSRAVAGGLIDDNTLEDAFARHDRLLAQLRVGFVEALKKVTEVLDEPQRKQLARWLEGGFFRRGWGGGGPDSVWA